MPMPRDRSSGKFDSSRQVAVRSTETTSITLPTLMENISLLNLKVLQRSQIRKSALVEMSLSMNLPNEYGYVFAVLGGKLTTSVKNAANSRMTIVFV